MITLPDPKTMKKQKKEPVKDDGIVTTPEELKSYSIVKVILKDAIAPERVFYRDNRSYFNIIIDNNIRRWIIRVFFEKNRNFIVLNDAATDKERTVLDFVHPIDLLNYSEQILNTVQDYVEVTN
ncbi:type I site-specific deoxyribonuclease OS=Lysinibacillus sphaericus OX=1421 GN=LS41612_10600 PE=3 SV=1 [Lysinibacillus sphaericus]